MALINCPECGVSISDKAEKCPKCAFPINPTKNELPQKNTQSIVESKEGCFLQTLNTGCMVIVVIILAIILYSFMVSFFG